MTRTDAAQEVVPDDPPTTPPDWYTRAIDDAPAVGTVVVRDIPVRYRQWGGHTGNRGTNVVLVHGGAAQSAWWDHIGPLLATGRSVCAPDLSGHGDSGRRPVYDMQTWAEEILAVSEATAPGARPIIVAHSMGGAPALQAACAFPSRVAGLILLDPLSHDLTSAETHARTTGKFGRQRVHPTREAAVARFRVVPEQFTLDYVFAHIADTSVRQVDDGWTWKHDPAIYLVERGAPVDRRNVGCPVVVVHPEFGLSDTSGASVYGDALAVTRSLELVAAGHHLMMDQPLAVVACLRALLVSGPWTAPA